MYIGHDLGPPGTESQGHMGQCQGLGWVYMVEY